MPHAAAWLRFALVSNRRFEKVRKDPVTLTKAEGAETVDVLGAEGAESEGAHALRVTHWFETGLRLAAEKQGARADVLPRQ